MSSKQLDMILKLLDLVVFSISVAPRVIESYKENKKNIQKIINEDREPTQEEWNKLLKDIDDNSNSL